MNTLVPPGQKAANAFEWVKENLDGGKPLSVLLDEASFRFDLDPKQGLYLSQVFSELKNNDLQ